MVRAVDGQPAVSARLFWRGGLGEGYGRDSGCAPDPASALTGVTSGLPFIHLFSNFSKTTIYII